ncbi:MAG: WG repeat-containing protein [Chitinophagaceae bacterium]|nr:WG repeat-containing protein [Chitinophagaceae bacterium]
MPSRFSEGLAAVNKDGKWGYIDEKGKEIIPLKFSFAGSFDSGNAKVMVAGKWIIIDKAGKKVSDAE